MARKSAKKSPRQTLDQIVKEFGEIEKELKALLKRAPKPQQTALKVKIELVQGLKNASIVLCSGSTRKIKIPPFTS